MKYNEGLQVLITVIICILFVLITTSQTEIENIRCIYATRKQKFNENRYITNMPSYHDIPYCTMLYNIISRPSSTEQQQRYKSEKTH